MDFPQGCQQSAPLSLARLHSSQHQVLSLQFYSSSGKRSKQEQLGSRQAENPFQKQQSLKLNVTLLVFHQGLL